MSEQDRALAKCAWRLVPFLGLLSLVDDIDRANVGFAALTMNKDLGFSPAIYGFLPIITCNSTLGTPPSQGRRRQGRMANIGKYGRGGSLLGWLRARRSGPESPRPGQPRRTIPDPARIPSGSAAIARISG